MSINRYNGDSFCEASELLRLEGDEWKAITTGKRFDGSEWINILPEKAVQSDVITKTYSLEASASYWGSGNKDSQYPNLLIQGSYNGTLSTTRRGMLIFNNAQLRKDIGKGVIKSVRLRLKRTNSAHGISDRASVFVKLHKYTSLPSSWKGDDLGNADNSTPKIARGETLWITLNNSALQKIITGEAGGFSLDADSNYDIGSYIKLEKGAVLLEVTFEK